MLRLIRVFYTMQAVFLMKDLFSSHQGFTMSRVKDAGPGPEAVYLYY